MVEEAGVPAGNHGQANGKLFIMKRMCKTNKTVLLHTKTMVCHTEIFKGTIFKTATMISLILPKWFQGLKYDGSTYTTQ